MTELRVLGVNARKDGWVAIELHAVPLPVHTSGPPFMSPHSYQLVKEHPYRFTPALKGRLQATPTLHHATGQRAPDHLHGWIRQRHVRPPQAGRTQSWHRVMR